MNPEVERAVEKKRVIKEDGRYLIIYAFERPLPQVGPEKARELDDRRGQGEPGGEAEKGSEGMSSRV